MKASHRLCFSLICVSTALFAQANSASASHQIHLNVVVTDKSGKPQTGLQQQDFTLLDNKAPQKILFFDAVNELTAKADHPVEITLVIDTVNTPFDAVANERPLIAKFLRQNGGKLAYPTSLIVFSNSGLKVLGGPSLDGNALSTSLENNNVIGLPSIHDASGIAGASDLFQLSIKGFDTLVRAKANVPGRKILIWLSNGWPTLAGIESSMEKKPKEDLFASVVAASNALRLAHVTVYNVDPGAASGSRFGAPGGMSRTPNKFGYLSYVKGATSPKNVAPGNLALQVLATQTGGRVIINGNDIASEIQSCVDDASAFYIVSFERSASEQQDQYHGIEVQVDNPGLTARTTTGYYSQPEQRPAATDEKKE
jgi:VWFA-related protein